MPNLTAYHESVTAELDAVKDRIRNLVIHWATDGEWKEAALRSVLRRHLPQSVFVGRGFITGRERTSTQIDLFALRPDKPTLFRDGDLAIVTPDVPGAIVEVKTAVNGQAAWYEVVSKLAEHGRLCRDLSGQVPWLGVFSYDGGINRHAQILDAICRVHRETGIAVNCVTSGYGLFIRYWPPGEYEPGDDERADAPRRFWRAYDLGRLSPSYFISNLVDSICNVDRLETDNTWFAHEGGKRPHMLSERRGEDCEFAG